VLLHCRRCLQLPWSRRCSLKNNIKADRSGKRNAKILTAVDDVVPDECDDGCGSGDHALPVLAQLRVEFQTSLFDGGGDSSLGVVRRATDPVEEVLKILFDSSLTTYLWIFFKSREE
jgi:hypothetical protein